MSEAYTCAALTAEGTCGEQARPAKSETLTFTIPLCVPHRAELHNASDLDYRVREVERAARLGEEGQLTYVIKLGEYIKIGYTTDLLKRLKSLTNQYGNPIEVLGVINGGATTEALLHYEWKELRVMDELGEKFRPSPELIDWTNSLTVPPDAKASVDSFTTWVAARSSEAQSYKKGSAKNSRAVPSVEYQEREKRRAEEKEAERINGRPERLMAITATGTYWKNGEPPKKQQGRALARPAFNALTGDLFECVSPSPKHVPSFPNLFE